MSSVQASSAHVFLSSQAKLAAGVLRGSERLGK